MQVSTPSTPPTMLSVQDIAREFNFDSETIRGYIRRGDLAAYKFGREYRIDPQDYKAFKQKHFTV